MRSRTENLKAALGIAAYLLVMCTWYGCEVHREDAELRPYAEAANEYIGEHFGKRLAPDRLDALYLVWSERSAWYENGVITIRRDLQDRPDAIAAHMRHEIFHAVSWLRDGETNEWRGVRISDWVAWED